MITFKNIAGNKFLAVGTIQRKSALNGEKSLTGTLYDGKDVLNKIDKGWSLEFDGEPYVVTYFERNDNDNSVSFDAIHEFFWDMAKKVLYSSTEISGSHTIKWYLDQIFANTGYTYALNFSPAAIEKDNWGNKTRLSLFNDLITSIAGEFEINGTLISIFQNIGTDLSTIVRYGFNLSDMTIENDATSFVTYGEGFGAYADQQNQTGDRVHVTYTSPLAGVYGILQAEPIDDQRYTSQANLQAAVKAQVDASFSVSVQLSLYDLAAAGYPYKMANVGDWLTAVDENLDFKQRIRIISIDDDFSADGTRISYTVTAGDIGLTKKYQDANASMASQVANAIVSAGQASTDANFALIAANGKLTAYYVGNYDELPTTANEGDLGWVTSGDGRLLYIYTKKADGSYYWEKRIDPEMGDQIAAGVTEAVAQANAHTEEVKQGLSTDIATAKSQAASQASAAETNAKSAATSQFNQAQNALSAAKTDLTNSIASEASARNQAVAAANSQAQSYANQAKADALNAVTKETTDRQYAVSALDTKATNAVNQAKSDITDTINAISVGGRNYVLNYSGLSASDTTRPVVNGSTSNVAAAKITYDSDGITLTNPTSNTSSEWYYQLITAWQDITKTPLIAGKQYTLAIDVMGSAKQVALRWGSKEISPYQSFKAFDINNTSWTRVAWTFTIPVGTLNTYLRIHGAINNQYATGFTGGETLRFRYVKLESGNKATDPTAAPEDVVLDYTTKDNQIKETITQYQTTNDGKVTKAQTDATTALGLVATKVSQTDYDTKTGDLTTKYTQVKQTVDSQATDIVDIKKTSSSQASKINSISSDVDGTKQSISDIETTQDSQSDKINQITTDVNGTKQSITDIQTKNGDQDTRMGNVETSVSGVKSDFSTYKTTNDGAVKTAQTTAQTAVDGLKTKVSQTDYNTKTGQLQTDLTATTQTANQAKTDIVSIKEIDGKQDARMTQIESDASGVKTTVSDLQTTQGKQSGDISTLQQRADGFNATVTKINTTVNSLGQINQLFNTEFSPDFAGWINGNYAPFVVDGSYNGSVRIRNSATTAGNRLYSGLIPVNGVSVVSTSVYSDSWTLVRGYDQNKKLIGELKAKSASSQGLNIMNGITIPSTVYYIDFGIQSGVNSYVSQPMLVFTSTIGTYVQGNYNNNAALAQVKITADSISNFVRDPSGNISSDFQTALSKTSIITGSTLATSIQKQTATQITSALTDNNGKIISLINQDTSGVQIAGKNIVLNGDTTVTGAFKVSQANIANGAIGTAQIGDAAITSAKIANLDVSKITGDVTNFIKSNWNGTYGSTAITSTGMSVQTSSLLAEFVNNGMRLTSGGESVGGIGVQGLVGMPDNYQGLTFWLNGKAEYMGWAARDYGNETDNPTLKMAWYRGETKPSGAKTGFNFDDDVVFNKDIAVAGGTTQKLTMMTRNFNSNSYPWFGDNRGNAGISFGISQLYLHSDGTYWNMTSVIKALSGLGAIKIPSKINSDGTVGSWYNVTI